MKNPFQIGDRVRATGHIRSDANMRVVDFVGTIILNEPGNLNRFAVEFDSNFGGHSCGSVGKYGHCQWMDYRELELEDRIVELSGDIGELL